MQAGDGVQALGVPNKGIVFAFFVQAAFLVPLVEREYSIVHDDLAGMGFDFFDDDFVPLRAVVVCIVAGIAVGLIAGSDFKFLAPVFDPIGPLQGGIGIPCGCGDFFNTEFAQVVLSVIHITFGPIGVDRVGHGHRIQAVFQARDAVVAADLVFVGVHIPFIENILRIFCDASAGEGVALFPGYMRLPGLICHNSSSRAVRRYRNRTRTAVRGVETVRDSRFLVVNRDFCQLSFCFGNGCINHGLGFSLQLCNRVVLGGLGGSVGLLLCVVRSFFAAQCGGAGFCYFVMKRPGGRGGAVHCGHNLRVANGPGAAADRTAGRVGGQLEDSIIQLLMGDVGRLVNVYGVGQIEAPAGRLRRCRPVCGIVLHFRHFGNIACIVIFVDLRADNDNALPVITGRGKIRESVISTIS